MANTKPFKVGDPVEFEHMGTAKKGVILDFPSGKVRIKDERGLMYRYSPENVSHKGDPIVKNPQPTPPAPTEIKTNNTNQPKTEKMENEPQAPNQAEAPKQTEPKAPKAPKAPKEVEVSTADAATIQKIMGLPECKKHQRIFLLLDAGCTKEEVALHAKANLGEVSNARKMYAESADKTAAAKALLA